YAARACGRHAGLPMAAIRILAARRRNNRPLFALSLASCLRGRTRTDERTYERAPPNGKSELPHRDDRGGGSRVRVQIRDRLGYVVARLHSRRAFLGIHGRLAGRDLAARGER